MRPQHRQFLSYALLAIYAGISILGDGLHSLLPGDEHQHHHHGLYVVSHRSSEAEHAGHGHDAAACTGSGYADLTEGECSDSHLCEICAFLYEAISQPAEIAAPIDWQPLVLVVHAELQPVYSLTALGCPAARGPPLLLA